MDPIFHIADAAEWGKARDAGEYTRSTRGQWLEDVGFIHCSYADQVADVGRNFYANVSTPHVVLTIDPSLLDAQLQVDDGFPHIYGPLNVNAVVEVRPFDA